MAASNIDTRLRRQLLDILRDEYDECGFIVASAQVIANKISTITDKIDSNSMSYSNLRDSIGEIGILISDTEKRLQDVEDCYTKLVDALAEKMPRRNN